MIFFFPRHVSIAYCVDATGAAFYEDTSAAAVTNPRPAASSLHPYTYRLLADARKPNRAETHDRKITRLVDLFPELADTAANHPAHTLPPDTHLTPWFGGDIDERITKTKSNLEREFPGIADPENPVFGGMNAAQWAIEDRRLRGIYDSILTSGFIVPRERHDAIRGVWLIDGAARRRFLVTAGKHRVAALAAIAMDEGSVEDSIGREGSVANIPRSIRVRPSRPGVVRVGNVDRWPMVRTGFWPRNAAIAFFDRLVEGRFCLDTSS